MTLLRRGRVGGSNDLLLSFPLSSSSSSSSIRGPCWHRHGPLPLSLLPAAARGRRDVRPLGGVATRRPCGCHPLLLPLRLPLLLTTSTPNNPSTTTRRRPSPHHSAVAGRGGRRAWGGAGPHANAQRKREGPALSLPSLEHSEGGRRPAKACSTDAGRVSQGGPSSPLALFCEARVDGPSLGDPIGRGGESPTLGEMPRPRHSLTVCE